MFISFCCFLYCLWFPACDLVIKLVDRVENPHVQHGHCEVWNLVSVFCDVVYDGVHLGVELFEVLYVSHVDVLVSWVEVRVE